MDNVFIELIKKNKISTLEDLKSSFRKVAKKTHPDLVGSDRLVGQFLLYKDFYEEAKKYLFSHQNITVKTDLEEENYRYLFFRMLLKLDTLELPFYQSNGKIRDAVKSMQVLLKNYFQHWQPDRVDEYLSARDEYDRIKKEKPKNSLKALRKPLLYKTIKPFFFNLCSYHITGMDFYKKQLKRTVNLVIQRLDEENYPSLKSWILFLIKDMDKGAALFG